jgi:hypothetical protein
LPLQVSQVALELALCPLLFAFEPCLPFGVLLQSLKRRTCKKLNKSALPTIHLSE